MKKAKEVLSCILILIFILSFSSSVGAQKTLEFKPGFFKKLADVTNEKPEIKVPNYQLLELDNGMKFYLAQDKSLPIFEIRGYINGGKSYENKKNAGISSLMTDFMLSATENYNEKELSFFKELNALSLNIGAGLDRISISGNSLKTENSELISLLAEVLRRPKFEGFHFNRIIKESKQLYKQQFYNDSALLDMYFFKNLYGEHPYAYNYDYNLILNTLDQVTPSKLKSFYQKSIKPAETVIIISGDFKMEKIKRELQNNFSDWKNDKEKLKKEYVEAQQKLHQKIIIVNKADATQAKMRMGYNFYSNNFAKKIPFMMGNKIFGGGSFNSRLMENLRKDNGYVYGINAQSKYNDYGGAYFINLSLNPEKTLAGMRAVKDEMVKIKTVKEAFEQKELFENVNIYNAMFPQAYRHQIDVLDEIIYQKEFHHKSVNYLNNIIKQYNGLEVEEVQQIFANNLYPEIMFTVIVGPKEKILPQFEKAGLKVEVIDN